MERPRVIHDNIMLLIFCVGNVNLNGLPASASVVILTDNVPSVISIIRRLKSQGFQGTLIGSPRCVHG